MLETSVENHLVKGIKALRGKAFKFVVPGVRGVPDRICFLPGGVLLLVETKRPKNEGGRLSGHQVRRHGWLARLGFPVHIAWTKDQVDNLLGAIREQTCL